jgi:hypothetical protein
MDDAHLKELLIELYEQIRHNHERAVALTNSTLAMVNALKALSAEIPGFEAQYAAAFRVEVQSARAEADGLALGVIDGILRGLREGSED